VHLARCIRAGQDSAIPATKLLEPSSAVERSGEFSGRELRLYLASGPDTFNEKYAWLMNGRAKGLIFVSDHYIDLSASGVRLVNYFTGSNCEVTRKMRIQGLTECGLSSVTSED